MFTLGKIVMFTVSLPEQPNVSVTLTIYVVDILTVAMGVAILGLLNPAEGDQTYVAPPDADSGILIADFVDMQMYHYSPLQ